MTLTKRDQKLLIFLAAILIFIGSYSGVYTRFIAKADAIDAEIAKLEPRLKELEEYNSNLQLYKTEIEEDKVIFSDELMKYPNDVRPEDKIMFAYNMEQDIGMSVNGASFSDPVPVALLLGAKAVDGSSEHEKMELVAYKSSMSYNCQVGYEEMKRAIDYIYNSNNKTALDSISISYDSETGKLNGTMLIDKYFITGVDDSYNETAVPPVAIGTDNIFNTIPTAPIAPVEIPAE